MGRWENDESGLDPDRVAEVIVEGSEEAIGRRGSGYLVRAGVVLTAAHVVRGQEAVRVRFKADRPGEWTAGATVAWSELSLDVAVLVIARTDRPEERVAPVRYARVGGRDGGLPCTAMGFPRHKIRQDPPDAAGSPATSFYRDSAHVLAVASPWSNLREGTLSLRVRAPDHDPDPSASPWEGMSGAAVWSNGYVIGLILRHHATDGPGELAAGRVDRWYAELSEARLHELAAFIGLPSRGGLATVGPPPDPDLRWREGLRALRAAERAAAGTSPYRLGRPRSGRHQVHVEQTVTMAVADGSGTTHAGSERLPAARALLSCRHLVLEGTSGAGKSTFARHLAGSLADDSPHDRSRSRAFADIPGVGVVVPAAHLLGDAPLPSLLRGSVYRRLGVRLARELPTDFFERSPGADPWLLLVDGLDEIPDQADRARVVDTVAADAARPDSPFRWIVTTRPPASGELEPLWDAGFGRCILMPFRDEELRLLAQGWLAGPDPGSGTRATADEQVEEFFRQTEASGLRQLVRTPLLAAIALAVFRQSDGRGLPSGRPGLYREFVSYLLTGRDSEGERRAAFRVAALAVGVNGPAADWLYGHRGLLLQHLASRTPTGNASLLDLAESWTRNHVPELPAFLVGWTDLVRTLLTGTGLIGNDEATGTIEWAHRSFADYLAAREAAGELPDDWTGGLPGADPLLRQALESEGQEQAVLTIACWAERHATAAERLLRQLLAASDAFDPLALKAGDIAIDGDSTLVDRHAALAGRLLAEGVGTTELLAEQIMDRLVERARSVFNGESFCRIVAAQPRRERARQALLATAQDGALPPAARTDAAVALGRLFGLRLLREMTRPLLSTDGWAQYTEATARGSLWVPVSDVRVLVAHKLSRLGAGARPLVNDFLDRLALPANDAWGRFVAADAAVAVGDSARALSFVSPPAYGSERLYAREISVLLRVGAHTQATAAIDDLFAACAPDNSRGVDQLGQEIGGIVASYMEAGLTHDARSIADRAVAMTTGRARVTALLALANAGDPAPAVRDLVARAEGDAGPEADGMALAAWIMLADGLWELGRKSEVSGACHTLLEGRLSVDDHTAMALARILQRVGDKRAQQIMRLLTASGYREIRYRAARELLDSGDRQAGLDALRELSKADPADLWDVLGVARSLLEVNAEEDAVRLLVRLVQQTPAGRWESCSGAIELLCRLRPAEARRVLFGPAVDRGLFDVPNSRVTNALRRLRTETDG
ncbi:serine protease [Actinacidiphila epipremni]|uniref:Trypsin-like serine protease n=1 Tax=Actinacidiphila epipremni TaxID=2053013 RepID=A0ABX0ZR85_9ACTN|nr:serine protease [Actinacidiphila epipremni]NJP46474.1 trypsin-like serine protease [Actinacidiphila epipremni]